MHAHRARLTAGQSVTGKISEDKTMTAKERIDDLKSVYGILSKQAQGEEVTDVEFNIARLLLHRVIGDMEQT